jgi:hypothetical protein
MPVISFLNIFKRKRPPTGATLPAAVPAPEGYASMVAVASSPPGQTATVRQMDEDYQIAFARRILSANVSAVDVSITADGIEDGRVNAIVDSLKRLWDETVASMLDAVGHGRVAFEKSWDYDPAARVNTIRKLEPIEPEDSRLKLGERGKFAGIEIKLADQDWETIEPSNAWWLALRPTAKYPHGRSMYFPAVHAAWQQKRRTLENLGRFVKRFAVRGGIAHIPFSDIDQQTGQIIDTAERTAGALEALYSGGTLLLPNDKHPGDPSGATYKYDFAEANPQTLDPSPLLGVVDRWDVAILRAFGIPEKTVTEGSAVGSFAMVSQQMLTLFAVVEELIGELVKSYNRYVCDPVVEMNYGEGRGPKIAASFPSLTNRPDSFVAEVLKLLFANPAFVQAALEGSIDLRQMLDAAGIPLVDGFEEIVRGVAQRMAVTQQAAAPPPAGMDQQGDAAAIGGEFGSLSTLQWRRNIKAIREALQEFSDGTASEVMTLQLLQTLGLTPERAQALIDDARDGTVEDPEVNAPPDSAAMANTAKPRGLGVAVPTQEALLREALDEFDALFEQLIEALAANDGARLANVRSKITALQADMRVASRVLGMLSLWSPSINTYADGEAKQIQTAIRLANDAPASRFPWLKKSLEWLTGKGVMKYSDFLKLAAADKREVLTVPGVESVRTLKSIRSKLADALGKGTDLRTFRESIKDEVALSRAQTETLYRTNMKQGYVAGMDNALESPVVSDEFPAVIFRATPDTRVRDTHWDLDGFVCLRTDRAYGVLKRALADWNCRCSMAPLSAAQLKGRTVKTYADLPAEVRAKYS